MKSFLEDILLRVSPVSLLMERGVKYDKDVDSVLVAFMRRDDMLDLRLPNSDITKKVQVVGWLPSSPIYSAEPSIMYILSGSMVSGLFALRAHFTGVYFKSVSVAKVPWGTTFSDLDVDDAFDWEELLTDTRPSVRALKWLWDLRIRRMTLMKEIAKLHRGIEIRALARSIECLR